MRNMDQLLNYKLLRKQNSEKKIGNIFPPKVNSRYTFLGYFTNEFMHLEQMTDKKLILSSLI